MTIAELAKERPNAILASVDGVVPVGRVAASTKTLMLIEHLPAGGDFDLAGYMVFSGRVLVITLVGEAKPGEERVLRKKLLSECRRRWGGKYLKRVVLADAGRVGKVMPVIAWAGEDVEISLGLPGSKERGDTELRATITVRALSSDKKTKWRWNEVRLSETDKRKLFEEHDVNGD